MQRKAAKRKKLEYPEETNGSRWGAETRKAANKLTPAAQAEHFRQAMAKIYGGKSKKTAGAGHSLA
jgi:hypothetical protein